MVALDGVLRRISQESEGIRRDNLGGIRRQILRGEDAVSPVISTAGRHGGVQATRLVRLHRASGPSAPVARHKCSKSTVIPGFDPPTSSCWRPSLTVGSFRDCISLVEVLDEANAPKTVVVFGFTKHLIDLCFWNVIFDLLLPTATHYRIISRLFQTFFHSLEHGPRRDWPAIRWRQSPAESYDELLLHLRYAV